MDIPPAIQHPTENEERIAVEESGAAGYPVSSEAVATALYGEILRCVVNREGRYVL